MDPTFAEAFIHRLPRKFRDEDPWSEHRVLGVRLRPFSLWHELVLDFVQNGFGISETAMLSRADAAEELSRAVRICRCRYGEVDVRPIRSWRGAWSLLGRGLERELRAFRAYVEDFRQIPEYTIIPSKLGSNEPRGQPPEVLKMIVGVVAVTGCTRREAWEMPSGEARWFYAMHLRAAGSDLDFDTAEEKEERARIARENPDLDAQLKKAAEEYRQQIAARAKEKESKKESADA
jgi:hypothetical protein